MDPTDELESELARSRESAGRLLESLAEKINAMPAVRSAAQYWQQHTARDMAKDVTGAVRRNPVPAIVGALALGFLAGMALQSRRRS